jgi:transketolase
MRGILFDTIKEVMANDERLFFLTADVGFNLVEPMFEKFPDRAMGIGVAEQNLVGIAAGLCNIGFKPICYSYTNFLAERAFEQIRDDICLHHYAPIFLGTTTGFDNGGLAATHHAIDDMAGLKALPNLRIYSPSSSESMQLTVREALDSDTASFIRFTKSDFAEDKVIDGINRFVVLNKNFPVLVISHGKMVRNAVKAAQTFPNFSLFAMDMIKPLDGKILKKLFADYKKIIVLEDNFKSAGLYNSIAQWMAEEEAKGTRLLSLSPKEKYTERIGSADYIEDDNGLSPQKIVDFVRANS